MSERWHYAGVTVERGRKVRGSIRLDGVVDELPVTLVFGHEDGPVTLITGGIHGCEYTSIDAAIHLSQTLTPEQVRGKVAVVPVVNIPAYAARSIYVHPADKKNLNRVFPGNPAGTDAERLAYQMTEQLIRPVDYLIDLHGGDMNEALVPFILYHETGQPDLNEAARRFAHAFGIRYVVAGRTVGSTYEAAASLGKVAVLAEAGQQGMLDPVGSDLLVQGSLNAMRSVGALTGEAVPHAGLVDLTTFAWERSEQFGAWYPLVKVGDEVKAGDKAGEIRDLYGDVVWEVYCAVDGAVLFVVTSLAINSGDPLFAIGA